MFYNFSLITSHVTRPLTDVSSRINTAET